MFCTPERNACGHFEGDGCPDYGCEWSALDAISEERHVGGRWVDNGGQRYDGLPAIDGQAIVTGISLSYLATMTLAETLLMADWARMLLLDEGSWGNARADHWCEWCKGQWRDCGHCAGEYAAVEDFLDKEAAGASGLTEGIIHYWGNDIAGELRLFRGWCPHLPFDKRLATEEREWHPARDISPR